MIKKIFIILILLLSFTPKVHATIYYIDFVNGKDSNDGLGTTTANAWQSINKFANNSRTAGDTAYVRRDMASTTNVTSLTFTSSGTLNAPITISGDYDNLWNGFTTLGVTATPVFGATEITVSASSTAVHNSWIYFGTDCSENATTSVAFKNQKYNQCEYAYEVASSTAGKANTILTLYLPYKGPSTGAGVAIRQMGKAPQVGTVTEANQIYTGALDNYWIAKGFDFRSSNSSCVIQFANGVGSFYDIILQGNAGSTCGGTVSNGVIMKKMRVFNVSNSFGLGGTYFDTALIDCNNTASSNAFQSSPASGVISNLVINNCTNFYNPSSGLDSMRSLIFNNVKNNNTFSTLSGQNLHNNIYFEDNFGTVGLNSQTSNWISSNTLATTTMSTTTNLRSGGGLKNLVIFPPSGTGSTGISTNTFPISYVKLFEYPIYSTATSHTYTVFFNSTTTAGWINDPLTTRASGSTTPELYIECEYYAGSTGADRFLKRSTGGTVDFNGSTAWQSIALQCTPTQAGVLYLRGWYAKPLETNKTNWFYMDTTPVISTP